MIFVISIRISSLYFYKEYFVMKKKWGPQTVLLER